MLLNIYLGSLAISWSTLLINSVAYNARLKREGFKFIEKKEESIPEKIASFISIAFQGSIPLWNIYVAVRVLCNYDKLYEELKNNCLKDGTIIPIEEESNNEECKEKPSSEEEILSKEETKVSEVDIEVDYYAQRAALKQEREYLMNLSTTLQNDVINEIDKQIEVVEQQIEKSRIDGLYLKRENTPKKHTTSKK